MIISKRQYFGTDVMVLGPITHYFVFKLCWAACKVLARHGSRKIIIGKDTRISVYMLERTEAGIVISAYHNLYYDNGMKFFSIDGAKLVCNV